MKGHGYILIKNIYKNRLWAVFGLWDRVFWLRPKLKPEKAWCYFFDQLIRYEEILALNQLLQFLSAFSFLVSELKTWVPEGLRMPSLSSLYSCHTWNLTTTSESGSSYSWSRRRWKYKKIVLRWRTSKYMWESS